MISDNGITNIDSLVHSKKSFRICHITSAHRRDDTRIFDKMCRSLALEGHSVSLIVADGGVNCINSGVDIIAVKKIASRLLRITICPLLLLVSAVRVRADIYHLHDPELLIIPFFLRVLTKSNVIYDAHEDLPSTILSKYYLPLFIRPLIAKISDFLEKKLCFWVHGVVAATPHIEEKFKAYVCHSQNVCNYPHLENKKGFVRTPRDHSPARLAYVGDLGLERGIGEMVSALPHSKRPVRLDLCGTFNEPETARKIMSNPGWDLVDYHGWVQKDFVHSILRHAVAGMVVLRPTPSYLYSRPVKMFEYMTFGLPVIASDFPEWRAFLGKSDCCIFVAPNDVQAIVSAIDFVIENEQKAEKLGRAGIIAVEQTFNWSKEFKKLQAFYCCLIDGVNHGDGY